MAKRYSFAPSAESHDRSEAQSWLSIPRLLEQARQHEPAPVHIKEIDTRQLPEKIVQKIFKLARRERLQVQDVLALIDYASDRHTTFQSAFLRFGTLDELLPLLPCERDRTGFAKHLTNFFKKYTKENPEATFSRENSGESTQSSIQRRSLSNSK